MKEITVPLPADLAEKFHDLCDHYGLTKYRTAQLLIFKGNDTVPKRTQLTGLDNLRVPVGGYKISWPGSAAAVEYLKCAHGASTDQKLLLSLSSEAYTAFFSKSAVSDAEAMLTLAQVFDITQASELYSLLLTRSIHPGKGVARSSGFVHFSTRAQPFSISGTLRAAIENEHSKLQHEGVTT